MAIEIVDLPSYKMVIFHSYVKVYQRVSNENDVRIFQSQASFFFMGWCFEKESDPFFLLKSTKNQGFGKLRICS